MESKFSEVVEKKIYHGKYQVINNLKALVNPENDSVFSVVTDDYDLITHQDALNNIEEVINNKVEFGAYSKDVVFYPDSDNPDAAIKATYTFKDVDFKIGGGEIIHPTITVFNSYNKKFAYKVLFGAFRLVCSNGLVIGEKFVAYRKEHHQNYDIQAVANILDSNMDKMADQINLWDKWLDRKVIEGDIKLIDKIGFNKTQKEELYFEKEVSTNHTMEDITNGISNYWIFFNLIMQYITHKVNNGVLKERMINRARNLFV